MKTGLQDHLTDGGRPCPVPPGVPRGAGPGLCSWKAWTSLCVFREEGRRGSCAKGKFLSQNFSLESWPPCISLASHLLVSLNPSFLSYKMEFSASAVVVWINGDRGFAFELQRATQYSLIFSRESVQFLLASPQTPEQAGSCPEHSVASPGATAGSRESLRERLAPLSCSQTPCAAPGPRVWSLACVAASLRARGKPDPTRGSTRSHSPSCHPAHSCTSLWDPQGTPASVHGVGT